ncbi:MAG: hypothetical protein PUK70_10435 [Bacteroidales bacterium]|nr:hypothetical protein [Bacteroidales bacterium]MDY6002623.1 hypothetical protein [Candidatus Cryptobacteroides sp.]
MKKLACLILTAIACSGPMLYAQEHEIAKPEDEAKKLQEYIDNQISKLESTLKLEDWQVYYVDSILNNDYKAMHMELKELQDSKVMNSDIYAQISDKWLEQIYSSFQKIFNDEQWKKYLKSGAAREKKARDKRAAKKDDGK